MDSCQDDPQYKVTVMKYLVFGTILSSLFSELHWQIIPVEKLRVRRVNGANSLSSHFFCFDCEAVHV